MRPLIIGSRGSQLALWQAHHVRNRLQSLHPGLSIEIRIMQTTGDRLSESSLARWGTTKGLFVKEIEEALLAGTVDLAVHSLKDVPTELPAGLCLGAVLEREDPRDALISRHPISSYQELPNAAVIGTSALRRQVQLRRLRGDFSVVALRGNVDTRLRKLDELSLDGIVLAASGLNRLGLQDRICHLFDPGEMMPAIGQGALCIEVRSDDRRTRDWIRPLEHAETRLCTDAERLFLQRMGGGCQVPMGAHATILGRGARFRAFLGMPDGSRNVSESVEGTPQELADLSLTVAERILSQGGKAILEAEPR